MGMYTSALHDAMISAIVLAAGQAARFGQCKQLLRLGDKTILDHVLDHVRASNIDEVVLVLGAHADEIRQTVSLADTRVIFNAAFAGGMSTSIQAGLRVLDESVEAALIVLGDQPFVTPRTIDRLLDEYRRTRARAVIPTFEGVRGNPVVVDRTLFAEVMDLRGDVGFRAILAEHAEPVVRLPVDDRGIVTDIDTREDFERHTSRA